MSKFSIRLSGAFGERNITSEVDEIAWRSEAVGGFKTASLKLSRPLHQVVPELSPMNKIYVYDASSPRMIAWQGYLEDQGRSADANGLIWTVNAVGPVSRMKDVASTVVYVDRRVDAWRRGDVNGRAGVGPPTTTLLHTDADQPDDVTAPGWRLTHNEGSTIQTGYVGAILYELIADTVDQFAGKIHVTYKMTNNDSLNRFKVGVSDTGFQTANDIAWTTTGGNTNMLITVNYAASRDVIWLAIQRNTSTAVAGYNSTCLLTNIVVRGTLYGLTGGQDFAGANYTPDYVVASQVVKDILGRWMSGTYDVAHANVTTTSFQIEQLAYSDPVHPQDIIDDLAEIEPDYRFAVWGDTQFGGSEVEYVRWDSGDVLEYDAADGFSSPESAADLYTDVTVRYKDANGLLKTYKASQTLAVMQGNKRSGIVDLGGERGVTTAMAAQAAAAFLAEHNTSSNTGTVTVARPILNTTRGRMIEPHMIRPGTLLRLRQIQAKPNYLGATDHNGATMFRVAAVDYSSNTGAAILELDNYNPNLARQLSNNKRMLDKLKRA